jgi:hypothetical protein
MEKNIITEERPSGNPPSQHEQDQDDDDAAWLIHHPKTLQLCSSCLNCPAPPRLKIWPGERVNLSHARKGNTTLGGDYLSSPQRAPLEHP